MVTKLASAGHVLHVWNRTAETAKSLAGKNILPHETIEDLVSALPSPKVVWLMLPAGEATLSVLDQISADIIIDGGNSKFSDTDKRAKVGFLGIGVSGGLLGASHGYCLMVGGDKAAYDTTKPILDSLAKPSGAHAYLGAGGAGHFVKMVHNGIEYGMMQSLAEGFALLSKKGFDVAKIADLWQKGSLLSGYLLDRSKEVLGQGFGDTLGIVHESGEAAWMIEEAKSAGVEIQIIESSLAFRRKSQTDAGAQQSFAAKFLAKLRQAFGGHDIKKTS